jgi:polar amino acid transport system permease protein
MDFQLILESLPHLLEGTFLSLQLVGSALLIGMILAIPLALLRISQKSWLALPAYGYILFFRGTPLLVQLFIIYYGLSQFSFVRESFLWSVLREPYWCSIIALALNTAAYTGEILRGAIQSVSWGQVEAGLSVGMSRFLLFKRIIAPQAVVLALPGYTNEVILLLKGSALACTVTLMELTGVTRNIIARTYKPIELFLLAGCIYLLLTFIITRLFMILEYKLTAQRRAAKETKQILDEQLLSRETG